MTLQPIKDVSEYKRLKLTLRDRFRIRKKRVINRYSRNKLKNINHFYHISKKFQRPCGMLLTK